MQLLPVLLGLLLPQQSRVLEGATVHTLLPGEEPRVTSVWIEGAEIKAVGDRLEAPADAEHVDLHGFHLIPALIDGYVNFDPEHDLLYTAAGVGLVRDVGGERMRLLSEREPETRAKTLGPDLFTAGAVLDGDPPSSPEAVVLRDPDSAKALLQIVIDDGVDYLCLGPGLGPETWKAVLEAGHGRKLQVWGPLPRGRTLAETIAAGQDGIHFLDALLPEGAGWDKVEPAALEPAIALLARGHTPVVPLFVASARRLKDQSKNAEFARLLALLAPAYESWWKGELQSRLGSMSETIVAAGERAVGTQRSALRRLADAGVPLVPGSGSPQPWLFPGGALHEELLSWEEAGIPAAEVLRLATRGAAEHLGLAGRYGSIEPGARANLLVLRADPRAGVKNLIDLERVVVRGRIVAHDELERGLTELAARQTKARQAQLAPLEVSPPEVPAGGALVLEGSCETRALGQRLSVERYRVAQLADGKLDFEGHVVYAQQGTAPAHEMSVSQVLEHGALVSVRVEMREGDRTLVHEGVWSGETWRMRREFGSQPVDVRTTRDHPVAIDAGSVTLYLVLSQAPFAERFPVVVFHEGFLPENVNWRMEADDQGNHQVRTHLGRKAFRFDEHGALARAVTAIGDSRVEVVSLESEAFGGAGLPLPPAKREALEQRRAAVPAGSPGDEEPRGGTDHGG